MIDTFIDKLSLEVDKRLYEICNKLPELLKDRDNVTLWEQDVKIGLETHKKYSIEHCGVEKACFCVGVSVDERGNYKIKASDVVYF